MQRHSEDNKCQICGYTLTTRLLEGIKDWEYGFPGEFSYFSCHHCHAIQINPFPTLKELQLAYEVDYHGFADPKSKGIIYATLYRIVESRGLKSLVDGLKPDAKILDVGCGVGLLLAALKNRGFSNLEGIDFNPKAVKAVQELGISAYHGTFLDFSGPTESYDLITMNNYLEHTLNPKLELLKTHKLLKPGGIIDGEVPNFASIGRTLFGRYWGGNHVPRHTFQFTPSSLRRILEANGFEEIEIHSPLNTSHLALSIQNFFQRRKQLIDNPDLTHGRVSYYSILMLLGIPFNLVAKMLHRACFIKFRATKASKQNVR